MITYLMGEIRKEHRGNLAAVIHHDRDGKNYGTFLYPMDSEEMVLITGIQTVKNPIDRVYLGVNIDTGKLITRASNYLERSDDVPLDFERTDGQIVMTHFLKRE